MLAKSRLSVPEVRTWCGRARESLILSEATSAYPLRWKGRVMAAGLARRAARAMRRELMMNWGVVGMQLLDCRSIACGKP